MIQDIAPHKLKNQYRPEARAEAGDRIFVFRDKELLISTEEGREILPALSELESREEPIYLLELDGRSYYYLAEPENIPEGYAFKSVREIRKEGLFGKEFVFLSITALQLANWYKDNRFCGTCGKRTVLGEKERSICCPSCGRVIYPRIVPAVIVGVTNGDEILLTKYRGRGIDYYALIAGFTEIGETLEQTVEREVMEEVGLKVKNITYYKSQPWGIVDDILAGFYCEVDGDTTIRADQDELKLAEWKKREEIELQPDDFSLTNEMMKMFKEDRRI